MVEPQRPEKTVTHIWHYLHHMSAGRIAVQRLNDQEVSVKLPDLRDEYHDYTVPVDVRRTDTFVVFDGHIPWGGFAREKVIASYDLGEISIESAYVRPGKQHEEPPLYTFRSEEIRGKTIECATLQLKHYFALLRQGVTLFRRYKAESLAPQYVLIDVNKGIVTWRTTS